LKKNVIKLIIFFRAHIYSVFASYIWQFNNPINDPYQIFKLNRHDIYHNLTI